MRKIWNARQNLLQSHFEFYGYLFFLLDLFAQIFRLSHLRAGVLAALFELGNIFRRTITLRLQSFRCSNGVSALRIHIAEILEHFRRIHPTQAQFFFYNGQVVTNKIEIEHGVNTVSEKRSGMHVPLESTVKVWKPFAHNNSTGTLHSGMSSSSRKFVPDLSVSVAGMQLKNPVIAASGTFGYGIEFEDIVNLHKLGGFVVKGLSREPMAGNPPPRLFETAAGMLNAIGLQNIGARAFVDEKLPKLRQIEDTIVIANVFGYTREDYELTLEILNEGEGIAAYELNVSCPNTAHGGLQFGSDPRSLDEVVATAKRISRRPLIVKLSPNVTSIAQMARIAQDAGADAISLINTFVAMAIDAQTRKPRIANITAGLSGPAIKPIALRMVYDAAKAVSIPVIGIGGISTAEDVVEFMLAGATAVQIGTASYWDPRATQNLVNDLGVWCANHNVERIADLTGGLVIE